LETLENYSNINSNEKPTTGAELFPVGRRGLWWGWAGRHEESNMFRNLSLVAKRKRQKKKSKKDMLSNVRSVSWYGHHNTYCFAMLELNTLLRRKHLHVSCNDHSLLIFSRH